MATQTLIQIKRSILTGATPTLANGELGFTANGDILFIGSNAATIPIGSKRTPGTLTANQALVVNATSMIDTIRVGSATVNAVLSTNSLSGMLTLANSTASLIMGLPTAAQISSGSVFLGANGLWQSVAAGASDFDSLTDVVISSVANNQVVVYDEGTAKWVNKSTGNGFTFAGQVPAVLGGSTLTVNSTGAHVNSTLNITDLTLTGNLNVTGTLTTVDATNMAVNDSIISLARNNGADLLDIGFYGQYNDGSERFTGLIWDTTDDTWYLFANTTEEPTTTVNTTSTGFVKSTLRTWLNTGGQVANAIGIYPASNTAGQLLGNTISRWDLFTTGQTTNSLGIYPLSNTAGQLLGNTIARYDLFTTGQTTNSLGIYPVSNTAGQLLGNTISRFAILADTITTTGYLSNSLGVYPASNTVGQLLGNTIARWDITYMGGTANALGHYPISNTSGQLLGNTTARWDLFTTGQTTNSLGIYPVSNTVGQLLGNTISRFAITADTITTTGYLSNSLGIYPASNTVGQLLGNTISRFALTGDTITLSGAATFAGGIANALGIYPTSNTVGQLLGNTISRFNITAGTIDGSGAATLASTLAVTTSVNSALFQTTGLVMNVTGIICTSNSSGQNFGNTISRWVITANSLVVSGSVNPDSNTLGQALGSATQRWNLTSNTIDATGAVTFGSTLAVTTSVNSALFTTTGFRANTIGVYPTSNTSGQLFGNTISRWEITANSLVLSTALLGTSGGTGLATTVNNSIYYGNSTNGFNALALDTTAGRVLQSNGTAFIYADLDGGSF